MRFLKLRIIKILLFLLLLFWFGIFLAHKIDLTTADLGRHIQNGKLILTADSTVRQALFSTNFYSYTMPEQDFINHHWLSGVVFYLVHSALGFVGVSFFYVLLSLAGFAMFFDAARKKSNFWLAFIASILVLPLFVKRVEVRPEVFTYFFISLYFWLLSGIQLKDINQKWLWSLPILMLLWINLHIGFVFGFLVLGAFGLPQLLFFMKKRENFFLPLFKSSLASVIIIFINPNFISGVLYPFRIFQNYGYRIVENQSIRFLENIDFVANQHFILFRLIVLILGSSLIIAFIKNRNRLDLTLIILSVVSAIMAAGAIRNFPIFALFAIPMISYHLYILCPQKVETAAKQVIWTVGVIIVFFALIFQNQTRLSKQAVRGWGLQPGNNKSVEFVKQNKIKGPIFNNYDIGGYLIYHLYPEKVFVDNRPEAYTTKFFQEEYIKPQEDAEKFLELDEKYRFNVIFFSHRDYTPWAQEFLVRMTRDKDWAPVYVDTYNIIFLKRNNPNNSLIEKYELPADKFKITEIQ